MFLYERGAPVPHIFLRDAALLGDVTRMSCTCLVISSQGLGFPGFRTTQVFGKVRTNTDVGFTLVLFHKNLNPKP